MPSKALLRSAHVYHFIRTGLSDLALSLDTSTLRADISAMVSMKDAMIEEMAESAHLSVTNNPDIRFLPVEARFLSENSAKVGMNIIF
jgi:hypothetical protein